MMNARDWSLVAKKVGVGAVITLVPLLILVAALFDQAFIYFLLKFQLLVINL